MANWSVSRFGSDNGGGDKTALFLKVFAGEVLTTFATVNAFMARMMVRTIENGKSAQFPVSGQGTAAYHTPGNELVGSAVGQSEKVIVIDDLLVADRSIASIDEAMSHFDIRSIYSRDVGIALSNTFDKNVAQVSVLAARAAATITGGNGGSSVTAANARTDADTLINAIFDSLQALDEKDVPANDRYIYLKPDQYYLLIQSGSKAINRDLNPEGNGSMRSGQIFSLGGAEIVKTNHLPSTNVNTGVAAYQGNFTNTAALVCQKECAGTVKLMDLAVEMEYSVSRQATLIVGKYAVGHGILRPECSVEIKVA